MPVPPESIARKVAALGEQLVANYGDSNAGTFVSRFEQYGRLNAGTSVGQCSDIHFAMLKAYKQMVGPNAKAYLVNFQTGDNLHHTNLLIERNGRVNIIDYGNITTSDPGQLDMLAQNRRGGHGLAYRIFTDDGEIDSMVAHIDSPMGKFLREVSTGTSSFNPFESHDYTLVTAGLQNSSGSHVKLFFGELGGGDAIMGVAVNFSGVADLPAGFSLQGYISGALAYAHRTFHVDNTSESLHSGIIYINTGLGIVSPKLELSNFTFQARTDLVLEGGVWIKQYSAMEDDDSRYEGDFNLVSRTRVDMTIRPTRNFQIAAGVELELVPSFRTAFPSSTDGSSGVDGLGQTLGVLPNRVTASLDATYTFPSGVDLTAGATYQHTPLGGLGEARVGVATDIFRGNIFLQGALDRDETPIFLPGARREVGFLGELCPEGRSAPRGVCIALNGSRSLEDSTWSGSFTLGGHF